MTLGPYKYDPAKLNASLPYECGTPGLVSATNGIASNSWMPNPTHPHNYWVKGNKNLCTSQLDCPSSEKCGVDITPGRNPRMQLMCGVLYGYWSANAICAQDPENSLAPNPFVCSTPLQNGPFSTTVGKLYSCDGATSGSGYSVGADAYSCGCVNWWEKGIDVPPYPKTEKCANVDTNWMIYVYPTIDWLKEACPSCYTYPFDDKSSTFVCGNFVDGQNTQDYVVTICPADSPDDIDSSAAATNLHGFVLLTGFLLSLSMLYV